MQNLYKIYKENKRFDYNVFKYESDILRTVFYSETYLELPSFTITSMTIFECFKEIIDVKDRLADKVVMTLAKMSVLHITFTELSALLNKSVAEIRNAIYDEQTSSLFKKIEDVLTI